MFCLHGSLIIVRFLSSYFEVCGGCIGVCFTTPFPFRNVRRQIFNKRNWIYTTGDFIGMPTIALAVVFLCRITMLSTLSHMDYSNALFMLGTIILQFFRFTQFFAEKEVFSYFSLHLNIYYILCATTLRWVVSRLHWFGTMAGAPCPGTHSGCCLQIYNCYVGYISFLTLGNKLYSMSYAGFLFVLFSSALIATNCSFAFIYFFNCLRCFNMNGFGSAIIATLRKCFMTQQSLEILMYPFCNHTVYAGTASLLSTATSKTNIECSSVRNLYILIGQFLWFCLKVRVCKFVVQSQPS